MKSQISKKSLEKLPDSPGVYFFLKGKKILYIGKATSLKDRVRSYFAKDIAFVRSLLIESMMKEATNIKVTETDSVLEALILEANLIKKHQPKYNTKEKDDKSFNFVGITKEDYPRVLIVRGRDLQIKDSYKDYKYIFGPYTSGGSLREALKIIRKIFPFRGKNDQTKGGLNRKSYLNEQLGLTPKFSEGISKREYGKTIRNIKLFFEGKKGKLIKTLEKEMKVLAKEQKFEEAEKIKRQIFALNHINDIALIKEKKVSSEGYRIEAYDVAHTSGTSSVGVMTVVENGEIKKSQYRKFRIKEAVKASDTGALKEILERRLNHTEWLLPKLIVVDGGKAQKNTAERVLRDFGYQIPVVAVVKGRGHKPRNLLGKRLLISSKEAEILLANSESHRFAIKYHREVRKRI